MFDVMNTMDRRRVGRFDVPVEVFISAVSRGFFSNPKALMFVDE